uniref:NADH-ubiquinone oxidoreductase chain 6 n=1 Tax=Uleiota sp. BMNH 833935 TaxID=1903802 RepID=A0A343A463_9CUCU|nr:NADH dehydrogenase subunit 6 [Uleiota sp. BMNH 833935]
MILYLMTLMNILFIFMIHPLSIGSILMIQTILTSMLSGLMSLNFWFSYIMLLIMIGGMLVLFMYMTSVASNEKFKFSSKLMFLCLTSIIIITLPMIMLDYYFTNFINVSEMTLNQSLKLDFLTSLNKFLTYPTSNIYLLLIIYLFITLIAIIKISSINNGPLKQKF